MTSFFYHYKLDKKFSLDSFTSAHESCNEAFFSKIKVRDEIMFYEVKTWKEIFCIFSGDPSDSWDILLDQLRPGFFFIIFIIIVIVLSTSSPL